MQASPYARNLREIVNETLRLCGDYYGDGKDGKVFLWSEVALAVNSVLYKAASSTWLLKTDRPILVEATKQVYNLPADCIRPLQLRLSGCSGKIILPAALSEFDIDLIGSTTTGDPTRFLTDRPLLPSQICFVPTPSSDGTAGIDAKGQGVIRADESNSPLRGVSGGFAEWAGEAGPIRALYSPNGNIVVTYVRAPKQMVRPSDYPDNDFPIFLHKDIKYGVAASLLKFRKGKLWQKKFGTCDAKWNLAMMICRRCTEHMGPNDGMLPS